MEKSNIGCENQRRKALKRRRGRKTDRTQRKDLPSLVIFEERGRLEEWVGTEILPAVAES